MSGYRLFTLFLSYALVGSFSTASAGEKTVVLTFDDAVKSHRTVVAPLLKELGFGATFFVTHKWMGDAERFMTWKEIGELHEMGFEIGNHSWTHSDFSMANTAARLKGELALVDYELQRVGVPKPVTFAYPGNGFGPEAFEILQSLGYKFARRGFPPERPYGEMVVGLLYDPQNHHPLLIPTTGDAYPDWTFEHFKKVVHSGEDGKFIILQFHGVPDEAHPWVHTPPEKFEEYMRYLKENGFEVIALRDLEPYLPDELPDDPKRYTRHPDRNEESFPPPTEVQATRENPDAWLENMRTYHRYSWQETAEVFGKPETAIQDHIKEQYPIPELPPVNPQRLTVLPYPGGRHPRIGFLDGAVSPLRGTKASVFLPWDPKSYIVLDVPEAIWSQHGLLFLAHTHVPTYWDAQNVWIENNDWQVGESGALTNRWTLPNNVEFGMTMTPAKDAVGMELWLTNGTDETLKNLRVQNCIMLKGAEGFTAQNNDNKRLEKPVAAVKSESGDRWILTEWQHCDRVWGNADCPCLHSDPKFPDCQPGETVRLRGKVWFYEGTDVEQAMQDGKL